MTAIISIAQQARPNCMGQIEERRAQLMTESTVVVTTLSSKRVSISPIQVLPGSGPVESLALPAIDVPHDQNREKHQHLDQAEQSELVEQDRPGKQEDRLDVED